MMVTRYDVEALYRNYGHSVLRRACQILGSEKEAVEVLRELFTSLAAQLHPFDGRSAPSTFLYGATTRACLTRLRDQRNRRLLDQQVLDEEAALEPRDVLAELTEDEACAAVYHYFDSMSHAEVAEMLGCSRRRVGDLLERVSRRLARPDEAA